MITAVIQHKKDTLVVELPRANTDLQIKLLSIGVRTLPQNIKLFGGEDAEIDVQLASNSRVGQHLCRLFNTENSLGDVNTTAYLVQTADEGIKTDLEHDIYYDQYGTAAELINDIKDRTLALGPVKMSLYFPLTGNIDEGDGNPFTVGDSFLYDYRYDINDLIEEYQDRDVESTERHPQVIFSWLCICPSQEGSCRVAPAPPWILQRGTRSRQAEYLSLRRPLDRLTSQTALKE